APSRRSPAGRLRARVRAQAELWSTPPASAASREFDAHEDAPLRRPAQLAEAGGDEGAVRADVQFAPGDLLASVRDHRIALERARSPFAGIGHRGGGKLVREPGAAELGAHDEAGQRPHA